MDESEIVTLRGVDDSEKPTKTMGKIKLSPILKPNKIIEHKVHIIPSNKTNIPFDGLLGDDFFQNHKAKIDYQNDSLIIHGCKFKLFHTELDDIDDNPIILEPRTETVVLLNALNPETKVGIIPDLEIIPNVFISRAITRVQKNNKIIATILNSSENRVKITHKDIVLEPFDENKSFLFFSNIDKNNKNRFEKLKQQLRVSHLNSEETESLLNICNEYSHIFHLDNDSLSYTNSIEHEIPVKSQTPMYTKSYRYPEIHKQEVQNQIDDMLSQKNNQTISISMVFSTLGST